MLKRLTFFVAKLRKIIVTSLIQKPSKSPYAFIVLGTPLKGGGTALDRKTILVLSIAVETNTSRCHSGHWT